MAPPQWFVDAAVLAPLWFPLALCLARSFERAVFYGRKTEDQEATPAQALPPRRGPAGDTRDPANAGKETQVISATTGNPIPAPLLALLQAKYDAWINLNLNATQLATDQMAVVADQAALAANKATFDAADSQIDGWFTQQVQPSQPAAPAAPAKPPTPASSPAAA
jgi:hypothetical protein